MATSKTGYTIYHPRMESFSICPRSFRNIEAFKRTQTRASLKVAKKYVSTCYHDEIYFAILASTAATCFIRSTTRQEYPHSLSYQATSLTKFGLSMIPASASKIDDRGSDSKSVDTRGSSQYPRIPFITPSDLALTTAQISSKVVSLPSLQVRSTTDTSMVGTRNAIPVSLPWRLGMTLVTALAAPVDEGMMLPEAARPPRQSLREEESTTAWVAVMAPC